jgi:polyisoprenoid-binding protein YceI
MSLNKTCILSVLAILGAASAQAATVKADFDHATGETDFHAIGRPSALKINGKGTPPKGSLTWTGQKVEGTLIQDMDSLDSGISMRTHHMKEKYLETGKYPQAKLTIVSVMLPKENTPEKDFVVEQVPFEGKLLLHGVEKPIKGVARLEKKGQNLKVAADFPVKISDYGIAVPSFAGITVADEVTLNILADAPLLKDSAPAKK